MPGTPNNHFTNGCLVKQPFFYIKIWKHPIETTIYKWLFGVPGAYIHTSKSGVVQFSRLFKPRCNICKNTQLPTCHREACGRRSNFRSMLVCGISSMSGVSANRLRGHAKTLCQICWTILQQMVPPACWILIYEALRKKTSTKTLVQTRVLETLETSQKQWQSTRTCPTK